MFGWSSRVCGPTATKHALSSTRTRPFGLLWNTPTGEEILPRNVAKPVRVERPDPVRPRGPLNADEALHLLKEVEDHHYAALWTLLVMLGLRRSEACGLKWEHVDIEAGTLRIAQSVQRVDGKLRELPTTTRRSNRTVPLPARCRYALAEHHRRMQEANGAGPGYLPGSSAYSTSNGGLVV